MSPRQTVERALIGLGSVAGTKLLVVAGLIGAAFGAGVALAAWPQPEPAAGPIRTSAASESAPAPSCDQQTWPYIDASCLKAGAGRTRQIRLVSTDRDVPRTLTAVAANANPAANIHSAGSPPPPRAAAAAANAAPAVQTAVVQSPPSPIAPQPSSNIQRRADRHVTVQDARKVARGDVRRSRHAQERVARPYDITPGRDYARSERRRNDTSRRVMAYGEDENAGPRGFFVPRENDFGRRSFFQR